ncbi:DUF7678 domain-containing protein [Schlesneria sp.]|uniref:DUF7678 domain-containing protein n=1 Tax=Schlesneria sp. TaxID=2762018 RepID=UPI002EF75F09
MTTETHDELGDDLKITKVTRQAAGTGTWVRGTIDGHRFDALVFPEHAEQTDFELADSRISKIWIAQLSDGKTVCNFDRGWDVEPTTAKAQQILDFLTAGLVEHIYG